MVEMNTPPVVAEIETSELALPAMQSALDVVDLTVDLMWIESTSGHEGNVIDFVEKLLESRGWRTTLIPVSEGRNDVFATVSDAPLVTLSTHLDTVPPYIPPTRTADCILGRGACDAKGVAAAMICAAERLRAANVPVALLFVVGEETCHDGAHAANEAIRAGKVPTTCRAIINGEPTESTLALGTKGAVRMTVRTKGRAAHSAYPHRGQSATLDLVKILADIESIALPKHALLGDTTINIGMLSGGVADNIVAPSAEARLMARLVGPVDEVVAAVRGWVGSRAEVEEGLSIPHMLLGTVPGVETSVVAFATDIPALTNWGTPYLFGPGDIQVAHSDHEFIDIAELRAGVDVYEKIVREIISSL